MSGYYDDEDEDVGGWATHRAPEREASPPTPEKVQDQASASPPQHIEPLGYGVLPYGQTCVSDKINELVGAVNQLRSAATPKNDPSAAPPARPPLSARTPTRDELWKEFDAAMTENVALVRGDGAFPFPTRRVIDARTALAFRMSELTDCANALAVSELRLREARAERDALRTERDVFEARCAVYEDRLAALSAEPSEEEVAEGVVVASNILPEMLLVSEAKDIVRAIQRALIAGRTRSGQRPSFGGGE